MKFACHSCGAKYQIADEKLGRKGVKVRCKKCGATIVVRPDEPSEQSSEDATVVGPHPLGAEDSAQSFTDSGLLPGLPPSEAEPTQAASFVPTGSPPQKVGPPPEVPPVAPGGDGERAPPMGDAIPLPGASLAPPAEDLSIPTGAELEGLKDSLQSELADGLDLDPPGPDPTAFGTSASSTLAVGGPTGGPSVSVAETSELASPSASSLPPQDSGAIESELGSAFAAMFSPEGIASDSAPVGPATPHEPAEDPAVPVNGSSQTPSPAAGTWFVAIRDEQVGPMTFEQVREHWVLKDLDPDSLCWQQGMPDWTAMRNVPEWAQLPDWEARLAAAPPSEDLSYEGVPAFVASEGAPPAAPSPEPQWRPSAASALDSLAQEELTSPPPQGLDPIPTSAPAASPFPVASGPTGPTAAGPAPAATGFGAPFAAPPGSEVPSAPAAAMLPAAGVSPSLPSQVQARSGGRNWVSVVALLVVLGLAGGAFAMLQPTILALVSGPSGADRAGPAGAKGEASNPASASGTEGGPKPMVATAPDLGPASLDAGRPEDGLSPQPASDPSNPAAAAKATSEPESKKASETPSKVQQPKQDEVAGRAPPRRNVRRKPRPRPRPPSRARPSTGPNDDLLGAARSPEPSGLPKTLDEADVLTVLRQHAAAVRGCVAKQMADDPSVKGTMQVKVVIAGSGRPVRVSVSPARFRNATVGRCVVALAKQWRFPKFSSATFPVDFPVGVQ